MQSSTVDQAVATAAVEWVGVRWEVRLWNERERGREVEKTRLSE